MSLDETLARVRAQKTSKTSFQDRQVALLESIEQQLKKDGQPFTAAAYFAVLLSLLHNEELEQPASSLLALVTPHVSPDLLRSKFDVLVAKIVPTITAEQPDTSVVRASIGILESILLAQPHSSWSLPLGQLGPLQTMVGLLALCRESRPKIRKRAVEAVGKILSNPPPSPQLEHPAAVLCAQFVLDSLMECSKDMAETVHVLQMANSIIIASQWPFSKLEGLCSALLEVAQSTENFARINAFEVLDSLFKHMDDVHYDSDKLMRVLDILQNLCSKLDADNAMLSKAWIHAFTRAACLYLRVSGNMENMAGFIVVLVPFISSPNDEVAVVAAQNLIEIMKQLSSDFVLNTENESHLLDLCSRLFDLLHVQYHRVIPQTCDLIASFFDAVRWHVPPNSDRIVKVVGTLRDSGAPEFHPYFDRVIAAAIRALGPERIDKLLPLNLDPSLSSSSGRAWLLPIYRDNISCAKISHFFEQRAPLGAKLETIAEQTRNHRNAKILRTIASQVWSLLPAYCDLPVDVPRSLTQPAVEQLLRTLYESLELRPVICRALKLLVESNVHYIASESPSPLLTDLFPVEKAKETVDFISRTYGQAIIKALLNVFSSAEVDSRNYILDTINVYLAIMDPEGVEELYDTVCNALASNLEAGDAGAAPTLMDIIVTIVPYLDPKSHDSFFNILKITAPLKGSPLVQKKALRAFTRLADTDQGKIFVAREIKSLEQLMIDISGKISVNALRTRLQALARIVDALPDEDLFMIPAVLSETVIAVKEQNDKTREAAFALLVQMGRRMVKGGTIDRSKLGKQGLESTAASIDEFYTMILAGVLGNTPHMISASVVALCRVFYEFSESASQDRLVDVVDTVWMFLRNRNNEVVKSVLGFVKISILALPVELLSSRIGRLLDLLLNWGGANNTSLDYRKKVRHIVERLLRKVGHDELVSLFPKDHLKLLHNIEKRKARLRRKRQHSHQDVETDSIKTHRFDNELDEVLYGSSSDSEDEDGHKVAGPRANEKKEKPKAKSDRKEQFLLMGDDPVDLLDEKAIGHLSASRPGDRPSKKLHHRLAEKNGRMIIGADVEGQLAAQEQSALKAYMDAVRAGPVRTQRGRYVYKSNKRNMDNDDGDDDDDDGADRKRSAVPSPKPRGISKHSTQRLRKKSRPSRRPL